jgi:hypothetical protein
VIFVEERARWAGRHAEEGTMRKYLDLGRQFSRWSLRFFGSALHQKECR